MADEPIKDYREIPAAGKRTEVFSKGPDSTILSFDRKWYPILRSTLPDKPGLKGLNITSIRFAHSGKYRTVGIRMHPNPYGVDDNDRIAKELEDHLCIHIPVEEFGMFIEACKLVHARLAAHKLKGVVPDKDWRKNPQAVPEHPLFSGLTPSNLKALRQRSSLKSDQ